MLFMILIDFSFIDVQTKTIKTMIFGMADLRFDFPYCSARDVWDGHDWHDHQMSSPQNSKANRPFTQIVRSCLRHSCGTGCL